MCVLFTFLGTEEGVDYVLQVVLEASHKPQFFWGFHNKLMSFVDCQLNIEFVLGSSTFVQAMPLSLQEGPNLGLRLEIRL